MGKLFEPKTLAINKKVHKMAVEVIPRSYFWIGVNDKDNEGRWVYDSDGSQLEFVAPWGSSHYGSRGSSENCVLYFNPDNIGKWVDVRCTRLAYNSICEMM